MFMNTFRFPEWKLEAEEYWLRLAASTGQVEYMNQLKKIIVTQQDVSPIAE